MTYLTRNSEILLLAEWKNAVGTYSVVRDLSVEAGWLDYGIQLNGILGLDFLLATRAVIDLGALEI